jgi:hypothetical protein
MSKKQQFNEEGEPLLDNEGNPIYVDDKSSDEIVLEVLPPLLNDKEGKKSKNRNFGKLEEEMSEFTANLAKNGMNIFRVNEYSLSDDPKMRKLKSSKFSGFKGFSLEEITAKKMDFAKKEGFCLINDMIEVPLHPFTSNNMDQEYFYNRAECVKVIIAKNEAAQAAAEEDYELTSLAVEFYKGIVKEKRY